MITHTLCFSRKVFNGKYSNLDYRSWLKRRTSIHGIEQQRSCTTTGLLNVLNPWTYFVSSSQYKGVDSSSESSCGGSASARADPRESQKRKHPYLDGFQLKVYYIYGNEDGFKASRGILCSLANIHFNSLKLIPSQQLVVRELVLAWKLIETLIFT